MKQAKCEPCKLRFVWNKEAKSTLLACPFCEGPLLATTHNSGLTVMPLARPPFKR